MLAEPSPAPRAECLRCRRPVAHCYCEHLAPIANTTEVVFLQHPRESRVAIGTCRMAHLALQRSELHLGVTFGSHPRVRALADARDGTVAVLYPGETACEPEALGAGPPATLIVLDGTWHQVRTMWRRNPMLHALPRIGFVPSAPGNYRIRREPAPHCLATVEAVVEILGRLDGDRPRFRRMLRAFDQMVEAQLLYRTLKPGVPWRRTKRRRAPRGSAARAMLRARHDDLVLVYAEANAHPAGSPDWGVPELIELVAVRPATAERFVAIIAPRRPLAPSTAQHLEIEAARLLRGESIAGAVARWQGFVRPSDLLCAWGRYALDLLAREGDAARAVFDVRSTVTDVLGRPAGGVERAVEILGGDAAAPQWTSGRAGRRIAALAEVVRRLVE